MNHSQAQYARENGYERVMPEFKRHILEASAGFESEPEADLYRINLLGMMLERYDELRGKHLSEPVSISSVIQEFADIPARMREAGFAEGEESETGAKWPMMTEAEVDVYLRENDAYQHRIALGVGLCTASLTPMMICAGFAEVLLSDFFALLGLAGMAAMIGVGVYAMVTAAKPKAEKKIRKGRFSLSARVSSKLASLGDAAEEKARKRKGKGIAAMVISMIPMFMGAAVADVLSSDLWALLGVAGMFMMIGAGVYQLVLGSGEKKSMKRLLKADE